MNRRQWLQALGAGLLWPLGSPVRGASSLSPTPPRLLEPRPAVDSTGMTGADWGALFAPARSCCIGLGAGAEPFIRTLKTRTDIDQVVLMAHHASEPQAVTDWLRRQSAPSDYMVVVIDASDPRAVTDLPLHATRWRPPDCCYCFAVLINRPTRLAAMLWNAEDRAALDSAFDALIEPAPSTSASQRLALHLLIDGTLLLSRTIIGYDPGHIRECLSAGKRLRTAATLWNRPDQRERALERLRQRGLAHPTGDMLAFVHAPKGMGIIEFADLMHELRRRLPLVEDARLVETAILHDDWPRDRRVLGVTG